MAPRNQSVKRQRRKNLKSIKSKTQAALLKRWPKCSDNSSTRPSKVPQSGHQSRQYLSHLYLILPSLVLPLVIVVFKTRIADLDKTIQDIETSLQQDSQHETKYKLVSEHTLLNLVGGLLCPHCSSKSLVFITSNRSGFVSNMGVECKTYTSQSSSSEKLEDSAAFDLNRRMVNFSILSARVSEPWSSFA